MHRQVGRVQVSFMLVKFGVDRHSMCSLISATWEFAWGTSPDTNILLAEHYSNEREVSGR